jgi:hypothetical protein
VPRDVPCRCARADAGDAIGREALDAGMVASGAGIKPGEALHREALHREPLDAGDVPRPSTRCAAAPGPDADGADRAALLSLGLPGSDMTTVQNIDARLRIASAILSPFYPNVTMASSKRISHFQSQTRFGIAYSLRPSRQTRRRTYLAA